ncbi:helix-turn-helix domain-containing protein [Marilutibacter alkalisoli]|uniref:Helix-turn-helix domain-containing protein n=1 Tax=Marilutibacter alkalisoli TaxID=2591633 RepID=A0A514BV90_9GAMM|nr:helix-turn-helix domain-containing protein [Lysobacter alkalisoli]QDH71321.1 helix-turn-helix domain-containing protein [Lysobacter alkalisoli]
MAILAYDDLCLFEFGLALEVFGPLQAVHHKQWYLAGIVAESSPVLTKYTRVPVMAPEGLEALEMADIVVVPGWRAPGATPSARLRKSMSRAARSGARFVSICTGSFLLGHCNLLDGRKATTHWRYADEFRSLFPSTVLSPDVLFVEDGPVLTSAGSAAGLDACLHVVGRDFGVSVRNQVARTLVMSPQRSGGQKQFFPPASKTLPEGPLARVMAWVLDHLHEPLTGARLARVSNLSQRSLFRQFERTLGIAPMAWVAQQRIGRAKELLEASSLGIDQIADQCGFGQANTLRRHFRQATALTPTEYRRRFAQHGQSSPEDDVRDMAR